MALTVAEIREIAGQYPFNELALPTALPETESTHNASEIGPCSNHLDASFMAMLINGDHLNLDIMSL